MPPGATVLEAAGHPRWLAALLARRGIEQPAQAAAFLAPHLDQLHDPWRLAGMREAVERLLVARRNGERVAVVGDYDADGVCSAAILLAVFRACRLDAVAVVPHRLREGYGLQPVHVERARELGCKLIVTVDCGTSAHAAAEAAGRAGLDVLITDHHLPGEALPAGVVLVNPRQPSCTYPFPDLAGVGIAFKVALAFAERCNRRVETEALLRVAALGTIADLVPLRDENRTIAALGLAALGTSRSPGLRALMQRAGVRAPLRAADVSFRLGPRLNAAGRLASADAALELLLCRDMPRAAALADQLESWNRERQAAEARVLGEARAQIEGRRPLPPILVAWGREWHPGVVGIAAGRIAREHGRPAVLLALDGDVATGSGRSVPGLHLHDFLRRWESRLLRFGGHAQAIGLAAQEGELEALRRDWEAAAAGWPAELFLPRSEYEMDLAAEQVDAELLGGLERLEPHGQGNPQPVVRVGPLTLLQPPREFSPGHLVARATGRHRGPVELVGWGWGPRRAELDGEFEVLAHVERDRRNRGPALRLLASRRCAADE